MDVKDIRQFFVAALKQDKNLADLDTSPNSNFDDAVIKPHIIFSKAILDEIEQHRKTLSLSNRYNMTSEQLDAVASKFFISRRTSSTLSLEITIYLNLSNSNVFQILTSDSFHTADGIVFKPVNSYVIVPANLPTITLNGQTIRVFTLETISNNATRQINANEISSFTINHPALINVINLKQSPVLVKPEDNEQLNTKIENAIFTRNLINRSSIFNNLTSTFSQIVAVYSVGYGDPEMQRDIVPACKEWSFHVGGTIDVYVRTSLKPVTITTKASRVSGNVYRFVLKRYKGFDSAGLDISNPHPSLLYGWERITLPDVTMKGISSIPELPILYPDLSKPYEGGTFKIGDYGSDYIQTDDTTNSLNIYIKSINSQSLRYSIYEQVEVIIHMNIDAGDNPTVVFPYYTMDGLETIQEHINNPEALVHCADTIIKSFVPVIIQKLVIKYDRKYSADFESLKIKISDIINSWNSPDDIKLSTLLAVVPIPVRISEMGNTYPNGTAIAQDQYLNSNFSPYSTPQSYVEAIQYNIDGNIIHFSSTNKICAAENASLSATRRTVKYFIQPSSIMFVPDALLSGGL